MKKILIGILSLVALAALGVFAYMKYYESLDKRSASFNGWLRVDGADVVNAKGKPIQLVGVSTHGIQWYGDLYTKESIAGLKRDLGINVFRIAVYSDPGSDGYVKNPELKNKVYELVDACIELDMYVVVDWHILNDNNPQLYKDKALEFFGELSEKYADAPNVIYEICNEPNGEVDWSNDIKPYAEEVIAKIREKSQRALVIVGTGRWSTDLPSASHDALEDSNVVYALHFYAGAHNKTLRDKIDAFREKGLAVFVSECGATDADGDGELYGEAFARWTDYMNEKGISWIYWSYTNKDEASAMLKKDVVPSFDNEEVTIDEFLSPSGELFKREAEKLNKQQ